MREKISQKEWAKFYQSKAYLTLMSLNLFYVLNISEEHFAHESTSGDTPQNAREIKEEDKLYIPDRFDIEELIKPILGENYRNKNLDMPAFRLLYYYIIGIFQSDYNICIDKKVFAEHLRSLALTANHLNNYCRVREGNIHVFARTFSADLMRLFVKSYTSSTPGVDISLALIHNSGNTEAKDLENHFNLWLINKEYSLRVAKNAMLVTPVI